MPAATPIKVGTATDQPTTPRIEIEFQLHCLRARALRCWCDATTRIMRSAEGDSLDGGSDMFFSLQKVPHEIGLELGLERTRFLLQLLPFEEARFDVSPELLEIHASNCVPSGDSDLGSALHQNPVIDGEVLLGLASLFKCQYARHQRRDESDVPR